MLDPQETSIIALPVLALHLALMLVNVTVVQDPGLLLESTFARGKHPRLKLKADRYK